MRVAFGAFEFDSDRRLLLEDSSPIHLPPKAFRLLEVLVASSPRALSKDELSSAIWTDAVVDESNLAGLVADLRETLRDDSRKPRFIRTVHGFGYAFCGEVTPLEARVKVAVLLFRGEELSLYRGENILGRDPTADVQVDDSTVSRRHARVSISADEMTLEDLGSKNGTFLGEEQVTTPTRISPGQTIILGDAQLILRGSKSLGSTVTVSPPSKR
ncbi:MAG TPA: FHA domain-containing protein [Thermoanaerobaculia bacterium]|nr:FHA domain-containing protein [Thermoanaerobaculia bacterium]